MGRFKCKNCFETLISEKSLERHEKNCVAAYCDDCNSFFKQNLKREAANNSHICGERNCKNCRIIVAPNHRCYLNPIEFEVMDEKKIREKHAPQKLLFVDIECISTAGEPHYPILIVAQNLIALNQPFETIIFRKDNHPNCFKAFCSLLFETEKFANYKVFFHNMGGYDGIFVLQQLFSNSLLNFNVIFKGHKILSLEVPTLNLKFLDFLNFCPAKLAKLPSILNFDVPMKKGYCPYSFYTRENFNYIGPMPDLKYFDTDSKAIEEKQEIEEWHAEKLKNKYIWSFWDELETYCVQDVNILRCAVLSYLKEYLSASSAINVFDHAMTLPQSCFLLFRARFLPRNVIGVLPPSSCYRSNETHSISALQWIAYQQHEKKLDMIQTSWTGGEHKIPGTKMRVDGHHEASNTVFEFYGWR